MLVKVRLETLIFEVREAGEGELFNLEAEVPKGFIAGQEKGIIVLRSLHNQDESKSYTCLRAPEFED